MRGWPPRLPMCGPAILPPILGVTMESSVHGWRAAVAARLFLHVICGKAHCKKPAERKAVFAMLCLTSFVILQGVGLYATFQMPS